MPEEEPEPLPLEYTRGGISCKVKARKGKWVFAEQYIEGNLIGYEVFKIQILKGSIFNKEYKARERPPASSHWGVFGWSYSPECRSQAVEKFKLKAQIS